MTDTGSLQVWLSNTTATAANFTPTFGHRYTFVVTATDNVSNTSQSSAATDAVLVTKYYYIGSSRVAMRRSTATGTEVTYLHTDHLGTVSIATNASAQVLARTLNLPYGGVRWSSGAMPTDYAFTGQKENTYVKLIQMGARWYDPEVGRWISPDTIVPDPANPQTLNRLAYALNNPLRYIDPTGHEGCDTNNIGACEDPEELAELLQRSVQNLDFSWLGGFVTHWLELLGQSSTGRSLINGLAAAGINFDVAFGAVSSGDAATTDRIGAHDSKAWEVIIDLGTFAESLEAVLGGSGTQKFLENLSNFHAFYAAKIGHELFHIAIGDESGVRSLGDCEGPGTCVAYRVEAKIVNEILYNGRVDYYRKGSELTASTQWNYDQAIPGYPGARKFWSEFSVNMSNFIDENLVRALVMLPSPPRH
jgi:RHS repeat-associated protein